jgi:hypothetical protein
VPSFEGGAAMPMAGSALSLVIAGGVALVSRLFFLQTTLEHFTNAEPDAIKAQQLHFALRLNYGR